MSKPNTIFLIVMMNVILQIDFFPYTARHLYLEKLINPPIVVCEVRKVLQLRA